MIAAIIFSVLLIGGFGWFGVNILKIRSNILLGRDVNRKDKPGERWKVMALVALGQKKMFKRPKEDKRRRKRPEKDQKKTRKDQKRPEKRQIGSFRDFIFRLLLLTICYCCVVW